MCLQVREKVSTIVEAAHIKDRIYQVQEPRNKRSLVEQADISKK